MPAIRDAGCGGSTPQDWHSGLRPPFARAPTRSNYGRVEWPHRPRGRNTSLRHRILRRTAPPSHTASSARFPEEPFTHRKKSREPEAGKCLQMRNFFQNRWNTHLQVCVPNEAAVEGEPSRSFPLQIGQSRRPDSNRRPLHYELSASDSRIPRFPRKCGSRGRPLSPWKSTEVHNAPAMCSNGVPILGHPALRRSRKPLEVTGLSRVRIPPLRLCRGTACSSGFWLPRRLHDKRARRQIRQQGPEQLITEAATGAAVTLTV
jgi:hypothetical protein